MKEHYSYIRFCLRIQNTALFTYTVYYTIHVYGIQNYSRIRHYSRENGGSDPRILRCKAGNSGVSKATVWFCTCLEKFCHKRDKSLRSLGFKWDHFDPSSLSWELFWYAFSHILTTIQGGTLVCVQYYQQNGCKV